MTERPKTTTPNPSRTTRKGGKLTFKSFLRLFGLRIERRLQSGGPPPLEDGHWDNQG